MASLIVSKLYALAEPGQDTGLAVDGSKAPPTQLQAPSFRYGVPDEKADCGHWFCSTLIPLCIYNISAMLLHWCYTSIIYTLSSSWDQGFKSHHSPPTHPEKERKARAPRAPAKGRRPFAIPLVATFKSPRQFPKNTSHHSCQKLCGAEGLL